MLPVGFLLLERVPLFGWTHYFLRVGSLLKNTAEPSPSGALFLYKARIIITVHPNKKASRTLCGQSNFDCEEVPHPLPSPNHVPSRIFRTVLTRL